MRRAVDEQECAMASSSVRRIPPPSNNAERRRIRRQHRVSWSDQQSGGLHPPDDRLRERSASLISNAGTDCASSIASSATSSMYFTAGEFSERIHMGSLACESPWRVTVSGVSSWTYTVFVGDHRHGPMFVAIDLRPLHVRNHLTGVSAALYWW